MSDSNALSEVLYSHPKLMGAVYVLLLASGNLVQSAIGSANVGP
ncbi:hypothetical protein [Halomarina pelagica]|nr:hypothetical protein [Halomarina sp. BND7]